MIKSIGQRIKEIREYVGLSQVQLSKLSKLTPAAISQYEADMRTPNTRALECLADVFDCSTDYILGREKDFVIPKQLEKILIESELTHSDKKEIVKFVEFISPKRENKELKGLRDE